MSEQLEQLYQEARSTLKARDYVRAGELLRQILQIDENYKDASRLLAQTVKLRRRRWYNHPVLWSALGLALIIALGLVIVPTVENPPIKQAPASLPATTQPTSTLPPTDMPVPTDTALPTPTAIPLAWKRVSLGQEFERDTVTALVIDPKDPDVLYVGMKNAGIFKSIDGGTSWRPAHQGLANAHVTSLSIDFRNPLVLYAGTMDGIYKTEDGGENWYKFAEETFLLMDPQDSSHLYKRDSDTIYESIDQGNNWNTVYTSTKGCPGAIIGWTIHPVDGRTLFISGGEECEAGIYTSNDGGHTWTIIWKIQPTEIEYIQGLNTFTIWVDKQGNYYIDSGWGFSRRQSNNGSISWRTIWDFAPPATFDPTDTVFFYFDANLYKFNLDSEQRVTLGKPEVGAVTSITISPYDPNTIYVGGNGLSVSRDGGLTWAKINNGLGSNILHLDAGLGDAGNLFIFSGECKERNNLPIQPFYISTNGGNTWDLVIQEGCHLIKDTDGLNLYRRGEPSWYSGQAYRGIIWRSKDEGRSWQRVLTPEYIRTIIAPIGRSGLLYGFTHDPYYQTRINPRFQENEYFYSEDYGNTWKRMDLLTSTRSCYGSIPQFIDTYRPMAIDPFDGNHVFVIEDGTLLESHDSCNTTGAFDPAPNTRMNSIAFDPNKSDILYSGTDGGAYISFNGGETWNQINDGLLGATVVYSIVVDKDSNVYAATPYGIFQLEGR